MKLVRARDSLKAYGALLHEIPRAKVDKGYNSTQTQSLEKVS